MRRQLLQRAVLLALAFGLGPPHPPAQPVVLTAARTPGRRLLATEHAATLDLGVEVKLRPRTRILLECSAVPPPEISGFVLAGEVRGSRRGYRHGEGFRITRGGELSARAWPRLELGPLEEDWSAFVPCGVPETLDARERRLAEISAEDQKDAAILWNFARHSRGRSRSRVLGLLLETSSVELRCAVISDLRICETIFLMDLLRATVEEATEALRTRAAVALARTGDLSVRTFLVARNQPPFNAGPDADLVAIAEACLKLDSLPRPAAGPTLIHERRELHSRLSALLKTDTALGRDPALRFCVEVLSEHGGTSTAWLRSQLSEILDRAVEPLPGQFLESLAKRRLSRLHLEQSLADFEANYSELVDRTVVADLVAASFAAGPALHCDSKVEAIERRRRRRSFEREAILLSALAATGSLQVEAERSLRKNLSVRLLEALSERLLHDPKATLELLERLFLFRPSSEALHRGRDVLAWRDHLAELASSWISPGEGWIPLGSPTACRDQ